jgi:NO-binding membrane sensor protein with MHYT domain
MVHSQVVRPAQSVARLVSRRSFIAHSYAPSTVCMCVCVCTLCTFAAFVCARSVTMCPASNRLR